MVTIRLQRTGRKGHAMYRMVVQDARLTPTSGKVAAFLGHYDPHAKNLVFDNDKTAYYLEHGAQPSPRVARLLKQNGVKLPDWIILPPEKKSAVRNPDKRRSTRPPELEQAEAPQETQSEEAPQESEPTAETAADTEETAVAPESETLTNKTEAQPSEPAEQTSLESTDEPAPTGGGSAEKAPDA